MVRQSTAPVFVSRNHLEGSFADVPLDALLAACFRHLVTGAINVQVAGVSGRIELRAGAVDCVEFDDASGTRALNRMRQLVDGQYEVTQRLPDLTGELGGSAVCEGDVEGVPLIALMRHCEHHALTCTITVVSRFDRAQLVYHAGEIKRVELNGFYDDDAIVQVLDWSDARFRVSAPALDLDIQGWPRVRREPTQPFMLERFARGTSPQIQALSKRDDDEDGHDPDILRRTRDEVAGRLEGPPVKARRMTRDPTMVSLPPPPPEPAVIGAAPANGKPWADATPAARRMPSSPAGGFMPPARAPSVSPAEAAVLAEVAAEASAPMVAALSTRAATVPATRATMPPRAMVLPKQDIVKPSRPRRRGRRRRALWLLITFTTLLLAGLAVLPFLMS